MGSRASRRFGHDSAVRRCGGCRLADRCAAASTADDAPFRGAALVGASLFYFLVPAMMGLLGAAVAAGGSIQQLIESRDGLLEIGPLPQLE